MNITKVKNHYRIREMRQGKMFAYTFHYKPTKLEARQKIDELEAKSFSVKKSLLNAMNEYVATKENILSPTTLYLYNKIIKRIEKDYKDFVSKDINKITQIDLQLFVNDLAKKNKPKTIKNIYGLVRASYDMFGNFNFKITLPKNITPEPYVPTDAEVSLLLQECKNTIYYVPIRLALYSLRLSEILGLTMNDIYDNFVYVNKAKVESAYGMVVKATKTKNSTRKVYVDTGLIDTIRHQGYIYNGDHKAITEYIVKFCKTHNIPKFTLHKLRHYFATAMHYADIPIPRKAVERMGGWSNNSPTLDRVYTHNKADYDYAKNMVDVMLKIMP